MPEPDASRWTDWRAPLENAPARVETALAVWDRGDALLLPQVSALPDPERDQRIYAAVMEVVRHVHEDKEGESGLSQVAPLALAKLHAVLAVVTMARDLLKLEAAEERWVVAVAGSVLTGGWRVGLQQLLGAWSAAEDLAPPQLIPVRKQEVAKHA